MGRKGRERVKKTRRVQMDMEQAEADVNGDGYRRRWIQKEVVTDSGGYSFNGGWSAGHIRYWPSPGIDLRA